MNWTELFRELSKAQQEAFTNRQHERLRSALDATSQFMSLYQQSGSPKHEAEVPKSIVDQLSRAVEPATFQKSVKS